MKMKKILSIALALTLAIGMLAGCSGGVDETSADISAFVDTDETLSISWLGFPGLAGAVEGLPSELLIEDRFNVEITPIFAENSNYNDKKNALLQSGEIPDLIYEMDPMFHFADARDEYLLELPYAAIKKYAPSLYAQISEQGPAAWAYSYYEGKNYGMPNLNHSHVVNPTSMYRADWLKKVGKEVPTTLDELHDVLYAFVNDDPDGNGKDDTYGYSLMSTYYPYYFQEIFGAYGLLPFNWQEVDGEIIYGGLRPETETALQLLADWYKDGIIYPAFVELDKNATDLFKSGKSGYHVSGGYLDETNKTSTVSVTKELNPKAEVISAAIVKGPDGKSGVGGWGYGAHTVAFGANGEDAPKKATRLLKMFETMYNDDELLKEIRIGKEGEVYTLVDENTKGKSVYAITPEYAASGKLRLGGYENNFAGATFWSPIAPSKELYTSMLSNAYKAYEAKFAEPYNLMTDVFYKVDIVPSAPTYLEDLRNAQQALMAEIIKGEKPADQYIEEFTKIWESTGGPQLASEAKEQQEILAEIYKKVGIEK